MRRYAALRPRTTALLILFLFAATFAAPTLLYGPIDLSDQTGLVDIELLSFALRPQFVFAAAVLFITFVIGWTHRTRLISTPDPHGMRIALGFGVVIFLFFAGIAWVVLTEGEGDDLWRSLGVIVALNLMVGIFEEVLFRGILFRGFYARHSLTTAVVVSSVLFGLFHVMNLSVGQSLEITIFQVVNATAIGVFFCTILLQANSLWPAIVLHALWNCYAMTGQLLVSRVDLPELDVDALPAPSPLSYLLPTLILLTAALLLHRWRVRMDRATPPPIPPHSS